VVRHDPCLAPVRAGPQPGNTQSYGGSRLLGVAVSARSRPIVGRHYNPKQGVQGVRALTNCSLTPDKLLHTD
jgi:hypothetical protein